jgi:hypothetical protein
MKRRAGGFGGRPAASRLIVRRDQTGKALFLGERLEKLTIVTPTACVCQCRQNGHDPAMCTGDDDFEIGGRPGSGAVDATAAKFGIEPIPEMVASMHEQVAALVQALIALLEGNSDDERAEIERELERSHEGYEDMLRRLRDLLTERMPAQMSLAPYKDLKPNLKKLAKFRNSKVAHSWPLAGNWFERAKRVGGKWETFTVTPEEVAEHMDLAFNLISQLTFVPNYVFTSANEDPSALERLARAVENGDDDQPD